MSLHRWFSKYWPQLAPSKGFSTRDKALLSKYWHFSSSVNSHNNSAELSCIMAGICIFKKHGHHDSTCSDCTFIPCTGDCRNCKGTSNRNMCVYSGCLQSYLKQTMNYPTQAQVLAFLVQHLTCKSTMFHSSVYCSFTWCSCQEIFSTKIPLTFLPWCTLYKIIAHELCCSRGQISQMNWDHLRSVCNDKQQRTKTCLFMFMVPCIIIYSMK